MNNLYNSSARKLSLVLSKHKIRSKSNIWLGNAAIKKEVDVVMSSFAASMKSLISTNMANSWALADDCNDKLINDYIKNAKVPDDVKANMLSRNASALTAFTNRKKAGLNLSQRVWNIKNGTQEQLDLLLSSGITEGRAAARLAPDIRRYLKEPNKQFRRIRDEKTGKLKLSNPAKDYHPGRGVYRSSYRNALRLARNEVNMSYRHSDTLRRQKLPFVTGIIVHLSNAHPTYDICDELQGDYPKRFNFGGWHPNCICYTTAKLLPKKEFVNYLNTRKINTSRNITTIPKNATRYLKANADKLKGLGNTPYFLEDNFKFVKGQYTLKAGSGGVKPIAALKPIQLTREEKLFIRSQDAYANKHGKQLDTLMRKAKASGKEVQGFAEKIAREYGGYVTPINFKKRGSIVRKITGKYKGDITKVADAVRTTIVVDEKNIDIILAKFRKNTILFKKVQRQTPKDYLGYSGSITNIKTSKGILGEIQVNTERMIFGKEEPKLGKLILGEKRWNEIRISSGVEGGLGHTYYEEYRVLKEWIPAQAKRMRELEKLSKEYYKHFY